MNFNIQPMNMSFGIYCSGFIHNCANLEQLKYLPAGKWLNKLWCAIQQNTIISSLFSNKKGMKHKTLNRNDNSQKLYANSVKPDSKGYI